MEIRVAQSSDDAQIAELWNVMIRDTLWTFTNDLKKPSTIKGLRSGQGGVFVAHNSGEIAGFASYSQFRSGSGYSRTMEHSIVLGEKHTGQMLGRRLLNAVEDDARKKGYHAMIAGISSANPRGRAFHEKMGYVHSGTLREVGFKNGTWLDLILMQKIL